MINKPPKYPPKLKSAPKTRGIYWCDFPQDAHLPEFWKLRPVLIISLKNKLFGAVTVIPLTSLEQRENPWAYELSQLFAGKKSFAICDKPTTVAVSRLSPPKSGITRITQEEFESVLAVLYRWLPKPPKY